MSIATDVKAVARVILGAIVAGASGFFMYRDGYSSELGLGALLGLVIVWPGLVLGSLKGIFASLPISWQAQIQPRPPVTPPITPDPKTPPVADGP